MIRIIALLLVVLSISCSSSRFIEPLQKGEKAIGIGVGGPVIDYGAPIPIPLTSVVYGVGIDTGTTVFESLHTTSLLFGNFQTDFGIVHQFSKQKNYLPSISSSINSNIIYDMNDNVLRFWPQLDINGFWSIGKRKHPIYTGVSNWFELRGKRSQNQPQIDRWILNPHLGFIFKTKSLEYSIEYKVLAPSHNSVDVFIPYKSFMNGKGAHGLYIGLIKKF